MNDIGVQKCVITIINIIILLGLPFMLAWHWHRAIKEVHKSEAWLTQLLCIFVYFIAICSEIPALWSRWYSYYTIKLQIPEMLYTLSAWDRWSRLVFYVFLFVLTYTFTRKKTPKIISDTIG